MSLKQSIVIVNEFTVKNASGGSRGKTPGSYVLNYMARDQAVETLTPVRLYDAESYIQRYMAREEATERAEHVDDVKSGIRDTDRYGGVAFGFGDVSLSDEKLEKASREIQDLFEHDKTVLKTVLSFSQEYLVETGLVDPYFTCEKRGDYRGNLDQMKLRMAIMNGLDKMGKQYFDDLQYVGVIQVDTEHVHCHLAMVDRGKGNLIQGQQRGKLTEPMKRTIRRGVDDFLDEKQVVRQMTSNISQDRRNAKCFIKKFTHQMMDVNGPSQFLLACLPDDERLWRADSHRKEMQKANRIVRDYVNEVLSQPGSGYEEALQSIDGYVRRRRRREGLKPTEAQKLYRNGQERLIKDCMNGVYQVVRSIPKEERTVQTPMLQVMAQDYETLAEETQEPGFDPMIEFGFRLRSYSTRLSHHRKERDWYHEHVEKFENEQPDETAKPLLDYLKFEEEYNAQLMGKYQHFLMFLPPEEEYEDEFFALVKYRRRVDNLGKLREDKSIRQMSSEAAEAYGQEVYGVSGGRQAVINPNMLDLRYRAMSHVYHQKEEAFRYKLAGYGMQLEQDPETEKLRVSRKNPYEFEDVKALDLHHLTYDFPYDVDISRRNLDNFFEAVEQRRKLYDGACGYLKGTNQEGFIEDLPGADIRLMEDVAERLGKTAVLPTAKPTGGSRKSGRTVPLTHDLRMDIDLAIRVSVQTTATMADEYV